MEMDINRIEQLSAKLIDLSINYLPRFLGALILLLIGWKIINLLIKVLNKRARKKEIDGTISHFVIDLLGWMLKIIIIITAAAIMGVQTASFLTILGTAGLAVGLALQGTLANVAGGLLILMLKPFKVGDLISTKEHTGYVKSMQLFITVITTFQNETIIIPNAELSNGRIKNFSTLGKIRLEIPIGVSYNTDIEKAREAILELAKKDKRVLAEPVPFVGVEAYADSSINLSIRLWVVPEDYYPVFFSIMNDLKPTLDKINVEIPFPQRVVHISQAKMEK
jgi:small conductance mechanosensitive channel